MSDRENSYQEDAAYEKLEPGLDGLVLNYAAKVSAAISLKRIADAVIALTHQTAEERGGD